MKPLRFLTCCYGDNFAPYLFVLLNSIDEVYGSDATPIVYYDNISVDVVKEIKRKAPHAKLYYYNLKAHGCYIPEPCGGVQGKQENIAMERYFLTTGVDDALDGPLVILDCDMLVTKRLDKYLPDVSNCDILFTYKTELDEQLQWPINAGIQIVNNSEKVRGFYNLWQRETDWVIKNNADEFNIWGGIQQAAFGRIIQARKQKNYRIGFTRNDCFMRGVPCKYLNETRRVQDFNSASVLHYKGKWRYVLPDKEFTVYVNRDNAGKMYDLWQGHLERWNAR